MKIKYNHIKNAARLRTIVAVLAKHGFQSLLERIGLGKLGVEWLYARDLKGKSVAERLRLAFEELGPTFVKLGQVLASRPDLIPEDFVSEFSKLQHQVASVEFSEVRKVLENHFGQNHLKVFESFDERPLAAASIAQVHRAVLKGGQAVVVKVQRPGIHKTIVEDIGVLRMLAESVHQFVPELRVFNPIGIVEEFSKNLLLETNFVVESNNIKRFAENFSTFSDIHIPIVYDQLSGRRVLVMEELLGTPLSQQNSLSQDGIDPELILRRGLRAYLKMVFTDGLFHGDLHAGNMFVMPDNRIGFIDFGMVGRLNRKTQGAIANMMVALAEEDYDRLAYTYVELAPFTEKCDVDVFSRQLRDLIAPYVGLSLKDVNMGLLLMDSTAVAGRQGLVLPPELVMFFKSIVTIEGMGRIIVKDFDILAYSLEFAQELVKNRYAPEKVLKDLKYLSRDMNQLLSRLPRQIAQSLRKFNSPDYAVKIALNGADLDRKNLERGFRLIFFSILGLGLLISASLVFARIDEDPQRFWIAVSGYTLAGILAAYAHLRF